MTTRLRTTVGALASVLLLAGAMLGAVPASASASVPAATVHPAVINGFMELENGYWGGCVSAPGGALNVILKLDYCTFAPNEQWKFQPTAPGSHIGSLLNKASNLCMEVNNGTANPGERVDEWYCAPNATSELWVDYTVGGEHLYMHYGTNECLDTVGSAGSQLMQYTCTPTGPQLWYQI